MVQNWLQYPKHHSQTTSESAVRCTCQIMIITWLRFKWLEQRGHTKRENTKWSPFRLLIANKCNNFLKNRFTTIIPKQGRPSSQIAMCSDPWKCVRGIVKARPNSIFEHFFAVVNIIYVTGCKSIAADKNTNWFLNQHINMNTKTFYSSTLGQRYMSNAW